MKFAKRLYSELVPEWETKYIDYRGLKLLLKGMGNDFSQDKEVSRTCKISIDSTSQSLLFPSTSEPTSSLTAEETKFLSRVEEQLAKVCSFYDENEKNIVKKYLIMYEEVRIFLHEDLSSLPVEFPISGAFSLDEQDEFNAKVKICLQESSARLRQKREEYFKSHKSVPREENKRRVKASLRKALLEFYRLLELMKNFKILNYLGFVKIMKKFDKYRSLNSSENFLPILHVKNFYNSSVLDKLMHNVENLVRVVFYNGNRHLAMQKLRLASQYTEEQYPSCFKAGLLGGLSFLLLIIGFNSAFSSSLKDYVIPIYGGFLSMLLIFWSYGFNSLLWTKYHINYKFIFGFDLRNTIRSYEYLEFVGWISFVISGTVVFSTSKYCPQSGIVQATIPFAILCIFLITVALPWKIFRYGARLWFVKTLARILVTPYYRVEYGDFFLADQMTSMIPFFKALVYIGCLFFYDNYSKLSSFSTTKGVIAACVMLLPYLWRLLQSLRRYSDSRLMYPHLVSASKYLLNLVCMAIIEFHSAFHKGLPTAVKIVLFILCTLFNSFWDSFYDFGLFRYVKIGEKGSKKLILRQNILYPTRAFHIFVFVSNIILRNFWIFKINLFSISSHVAMFLLIISEGIRRFMWNLMRLENEQLSNCGLFRAVLEIPLPYESSNTKMYESEIDEDKNSFTTNETSINVSQSDTSENQNLNSMSTVNATLNAKTV